MALKVGSLPRMNPKSGDKPKHLPCSPTSLVRMLRAIGDRGGSRITSIPSRAINVRNAVEYLVSRSTIKCRFAEEHVVFAVRETSRHLQHPRLIRVRRDSANDDSASGKIDHEEDIVCD